MAQQHVNVEFEPAMVEVVRDDLSEPVRIATCYYHLKRSLWRRVQEDGLQVVYQEDEEAQFALGGILAPACLLIEEVSDSAHHTRDIAPPRMQPSGESFERAYVRRRWPNNAPARALGRSGRCHAPRPLGKKHI